MQNRWKSPVLWVGIVSIVTMIMGNYGLYDLIGMPEGTFREIVKTVLGLFGIFASVNNPEKSNGI